MTTNIKEALEKTARALEEIKAIVWGECPSLLNEDSGGNARLDIDIDDALELAKAALPTLQPDGERREAIAREPFAWAYRSIFNEHSWTLLKAEPHFDNDQYIKKPLYLASGLVQNEAAIRRDEREKCAKIADREAEFWQDAESSSARIVAAAIRSARDGGAS